MTTLVRERSECPQALEAVSLVAQMTGSVVPATVVVRLQDVNLRDRTFDIRGARRESRQYRRMPEREAALLISTPVVWRRRIPYTVVCGFATLDELWARSHRLRPEQLAGVEVGVRVLEDARDSASVVDAMVAASVSLETGEFDLTTVECARAIRVLARPEWPGDPGTRIRAYLRSVQVPARTAARARVLAAADPAVWERVAGGGLTLRGAAEMLRTAYGPGSSIAVGADPHSGAGLAHYVRASPPRDGARDSPRPPSVPGCVWRQTRKGRVILRRIDLGPRDPPDRLRAIARDLEGLRSMILFFAAQAEEAPSHPRAKRGAP